MKKTLFLLTLLVLPFSIYAQTGIPPFGSTTSYSFDTINNQNLNAYFAIPIFSDAGRGMPLNLSLVNNSLVWQPVTVGSTTTWTPVTDPSGNPTWGWLKDMPPGGVLFYYVHNTQVKCFVGSNWYWATISYHSGYSYVDVVGTSHPFGLTFNVSDCDLYNDPGPYVAYALDSSGYYVDANNYDSPKVTSPSGIQGVNGNGTAVDTNGNYVTKTVVSSTETDWKDSVGNTALKIFYTGSSSNPSQIQYNFLDGTGSSSYKTITLTFMSASIKTNFGCSGVGEYTSTGTVYLPHQLSIPSPVSGTVVYTFDYEPTPGFSGYYTGRIKKVTLPTGGSYEYDYPGTHDSINCSDGTTASMNRVVTNESGSKTWDYVRNTTNRTTTVTSPQLADTGSANDAVYTFNSLGQEITRQIYSNSPGTSQNLLRTISTTWATNGTPSTQVTLLEDGSTRSEADTTFDANGNLQSLTEYDWGTGQHGSTNPIRTTTLTYVTGTNYTSRNIINLVTSRVVKDSGGTIQYRQDTAYDGSALTCTTGAVQHDETSFPCSMLYRGDPTSITTYKDPVTPSQPVVKNFTYDWFGNLRSAQLNCCQQKTWSYSSTTQFSQPDSVTSGTSPTQLTIYATYNQYTGQMTTSTDENNQVTHYYYDFLRRPTSVTRPDGTMLSQTYDDTGHTATATVPIDSGKSVSQTSSVDLLGYPSLVTIKDGSSNIYSITQTVNDQLGRSYQTSNPYTGSPSYETIVNFDALGRLTKTTLPDNSATSYSYSANTVTVTDPAGKKRKSVVDAAGRLTYVYEPDGNNNLNVDTDYTYSVLDELITVVGGSQTRTYQYDKLGRLTDRAEPEIKNAGGQGHYVFQYNDYDLVTQRTDPRGVITTYGYDTLNRLHTISYNVGSTGVAATPGVTLMYGTTPSQNNNGRLTTMADGVGSENYSYDILGRMTQLQKIVTGNSTYTTNYQYNLASELTQITYPSGRVVQQTVDPIGRLCAIAQTASSCTTGTNVFANNYNYNNPASQLQGFNYGNGVTATLGYSSDRLQLTSLKYVKGSTTLFSLNYSYGAVRSNNGQIAGITDNVDNGRSVAYTYDYLARLSTAVTTGSAVYAKWGLSMTYDRYGNRNAQTVTAGTAPSSSATADVTTNRLTTGYDYDMNGNLTNDGSNTIAYDAENRAITSSGGLGSGTYTYDGNDLRVKKVSSSTTTVYIFSGSAAIAEYVNGAAPASPTREYIYSGSTLLAKVESGATQYYHPDLLSTRLMTDSSGNKLGEQGHYPFGESWYLTNTTTKWQFTDYERDSESANDYAYARFYINRLGRFSALDPLAGSAADPQSLDRYSYVDDDPENGVDPRGLCPNWYAKSFAPAGKVICTEAQPLGGREIIGWYALYDFSGWNPAGGNPDLGTWHPPYWDLLTISFFPIYGPSQNQSTGGNGSGFTLGIRAPGQTFKQCLAANAHTYSLGGSAELGVNVVTGTNTDITSNRAVDFFTGNSVNSFLFGNATDAGLAAAGEAPGALEAGVGVGLTYGRRTSGSIALNLAGKGGLPQALSSSTGGLRSALGSIGNALNLGLKASTRLAIDLGLTGAEAIGCAIPRS